MIGDLLLINEFVFLFSHFHLDHCGALPYFSEMVGYDGPIYMTHPTKAICPILLVRLILVKQAFSNPSVIKLNLADSRNIHALPAIYYAFLGMGGGKK